MGSSASIHHRPVATTSAKTLLTNYPVLSQDQFLQNQRLAASISTNRKVNEVVIRESGFSRTEVTISEGENVAFTLTSRKLAPQAARRSTDDNEEQATTSADYRSALEDCSLVQVVSSDDSSYRPVVGGYQYDRIGDAKIVIKFKLSGEYYFKLSNHPSGQNLSVLKVTVLPEQPLNLLITDEGFLPRIIRIDEGSTLRWSWNKLSQAHSIYEAEYCDAHTGLFQTSKELVAPALSNTYKRKFDEAGVYYFKTESKNSDQKNVCIVEVQQSYREHAIDIHDNKFSPARITVDEGDLVWFNWSKDKCLKKHCVYQIHPPAPDHPEDQAYIAVSDGFKWTSPTRTGTLCHRFDKCGVYYFSDISDNECASYIGVIAVKKKPAHLYINYNDETKRFDKETITADTGDLIWWKWNRSVGLTMNLIDATLLMDKKLDLLKCKSSAKGCKQLEANGLAKTGVYSYKVKKPGSYYFRVFNGVEEFVCTLIAIPAQRDHKVTITDESAKPSILNIHPEDRVWFVWDDTRRAHNIRQVTHSNQIIPDGFLSGSLMDSPCAFVECFNNLGIFYYRSDNLNSLMGAVVVVPEPAIQVVHVNESGINPDPMVIKVNDMILWEFASYQAYDLVQIKSIQDFYNYGENSTPILPRRFLSRAFREPGAYHFVSLAFDLAVNQGNVDRSRGIDKTLISSVIVDKLDEYESVLLDATGFHPNFINVELGKSLLFDWRDTNETHNIVHVTLPNEKQTMRVIDGPKAFNSGKPVLNNSFLYTFEEEGSYCVMSEGANKSGSGRPYCLIQVLRSVHKAATPRLAHQESFVLLKNHKIHLECDTPDVIIHYTTDGSTPNKLTQVYKRETGITLSEEGINIIRAISYSERHLTSNIFTSPRFYILANQENVKTDYVSTTNTEVQSVTNEEWWRCIPRIVVNQFGVGCLEIIWDKPSAQFLDMISHYKIFLNKVSYRKRIAAHVNRVVAKGLASSRSYEITVMVYPKDKTLLPQQSNIMEVKTPKTTNLGGPVISLKVNSVQDQITVTWLSIDSPSCPIDHYDLFVNEEKKETIKPAPGRHKIVIYGCVFEKKYSIIVIAIPKDGTIALISNELEVKLPLGLDEIDLPDPDLRNLDSDYYDEYIEVVDGEKAQTAIEKYSSSLKQSTGTQTRESTSRKSSRYKKPDNMKGVKVNQIEIVESIAARDAYPRRTVPSEVNIIPHGDKDSRYGEYISDALGNFIYLPKSTKPVFKVKSNKSSLSNRSKSSGGGELLSARKIKSDSNPNETLWETYEFVDFKETTTASRSKSDKKRSKAVKYEANLLGDGIFSRSVPVVSAVGGKKKVSYASIDDSKKIVKNDHDDVDIYDKFPHVYDDSQTKVPQRHVDVSLMNERVLGQTHYRGPYGLNSADYLRKNLYVDNFEHQ